jgi:hypothetical protein
VRRICARNCLDRDDDSRYFSGFVRVDRRASSFLPSSAHPPSALIRPSFRSVLRLPGPRFVLNRVAVFFFPFQLYQRLDFDFDFDSISMSIGGVCLILDV